ncbi:MAG: hypothetical protein ACE5FS_08875 [Paracoccaceae bacterium]
MTVAHVAGCREAVVSRDRRSAGLASGFAVSVSSAQLAGPETRDPPSRPARFIAGAGFMAA